MLQLEMSAVTPPAFAAAGYVPALENLAGKAGLG